MTGGMTVVRCSSRCSECRDWFQRGAAEAWSVSGHKRMNEERYAREREYFDAVAAQARVEKMPVSVVERYRNPHWPRLFPLEMMFHLLGRDGGQRILQVGSGEGLTGVQLAHCGHRVTGVEISPKAVEVARARARTEEVDAEFVVGNVVTDDIWDEGAYDVVWCEAVLHHLVGDLDTVIAGVHRALRPGGLFVSTEPLALPRWLESVRDRLPVARNGTPDEQPLRKTELDIVRRQFPDLHLHRYRILSRIDRLTNSVPVIGFVSALDKVILAAPPARVFSSVAVMWARKPAASPISA